MKNMVHDVSLDHLKEEEVEMILKVLERDDQIQKNEDARRQKLRDSIRFERIPGKRLSVKLRTGDWVNEITDPTRQKEKRGTDVVRASIRRKKWKKEEDTLQKIDEYADTDRLHPSKPDVVVDADKINVEPARSPARKPTIRRKQLPKTSGKQVTFSDNKTEKIIFNDATTPAEDRPETESSKGDAREGHYVIPDEGARQDQGQQYDETTVPSDTNFESYHSSFALRTPQPESEQMSEVQQEEKSDKEKTTKKVRVIKRKGSSRRKPVSKITDDSDRDSLFRAPEQKGIKDLAENISSEVAVAAVDQVAKESSVTDTIKPVFAPIDPAATTVSDYSIDDSLAVEEIITIATAGIVHGTPTPLQEVANASVLPDRDDVPHEARESYDLPKQEDPSRHFAEIQYSSTEPQGGEHDSHPVDDFDYHNSSNQDDLYTHTTAVEPQDGDHDTRPNDTSNVLGIAQDYADVTLKPNDFSQMLKSDGNEKSSDDDGGRTPIVEKSHDLDGMELLKEIEAVLPQVSTEAATAEDAATLSQKYTMDQDTDTYDASQPAQLVENYNVDERGDAPDDEIRKDDASKPKKKVIKRIKKSKRDKQDEKTESPDHNSREELDDQARTLIDEVSRSMMTFGEVEVNHPSSPVAGRKKIVKKIVKKKKADDSTTDDHHESPKKVEENTGEDANADEEFGMSRRKTVRRKVSKRQPPPPPSQ